MKYISLFAGIGGFDLALNRLGHECVYVNEWDKDCADIYEKRFNHRPDTRDITTVKADEIPDHDLLVGGFPCQSFSLAGQRGGFNDTRGTLFFDVARIVKEKRPKHLLLENVKGLLSHDNGRTIKTILSTLNELGYDTETMVLDSSDFKAGQRPRIFIFSTYRNKEYDVRKGAEQASPLYISFCERTRITDDTLQEVGRSSARIIRTFAKLPDWMDRWETIYGSQENVR